MSEVSYESMLRRIERLERSNRAMKFIVLGAIVLSFAFNAFPAMTAVFPHGPKAVDAETFNLVSPKGVLLAQLAGGVNGGYLAFFDSKGKTEMEVGTSGGSQVDQFIGASIWDGNVLIPATTTGNNPREIWSASVANDVTTYGNFILDDAGKTRLSSTTAGDGTNAVFIAYDGTNVRGGFGLGTSGPGLFFNDSTGTTRLLEGVSLDNSATSLTMLNSGGDAKDPLVDLAAEGSGSSTLLQIEDNNHMPRLLEGFSAGAGTGTGELIELFNAAGTQDFEAPCTGAACP